VPMDRFGQTAIAGNATPVRILEGKGFKEKLQALYIKLTTDATVANRYVVVLLTSPNGNAWLYYFPVQTASLTVYMSLTDLIPDVFLERSWTYQIQVLSGVAGDLLEYFGCNTWWVPKRGVT